LVLVLSRTNTAWLVFAGGMVEWFRDFSYAHDLSVLSLHPRIGCYLIQLWCGSTLDLWTDESILASARSGAAIHAGAIDARDPNDSDSRCRVGGVLGYRV
jgi:hypothetical protein